MVIKHFQIQTWMIPDVLGTVNRVKAARPSSPVKRTLYNGHLWQALREILVPVELFYGI